ncbi:MAG: OB-fold domain-containing protein, partial [Chloroflexi bacterium]|nr:OB-fold domain-containing protein [Chloroflexota bacterium]
MSRYLPEEWALPIVNDLNREFFTTGKLMLQQCVDCGTVQHPPEEVCHSCQGLEFAHVQSGGRGTVYSYAVMHYPAHPTLQTAVPYGVVLVQLDDYPQVRVLGNCLNVEPGDLDIGMRVQVTWEELTDPTTGEQLRMPQW